LGDGGDNGIEGDLKVKWVEQYHHLELHLQWKKKNGSPSVML